jgi:hypothetical protein
MPDTCFCPEKETETGAVSIPREGHLHGWAALLECVYQRAGRHLPQLQLLDGHQVPAPYHSLLVHSSDMTPTLERFFGQPLGLEVLGRELQGDCYLREVVLTLGPQRRRILYGVIRIILNHLPPAVRQRILEERFPLGHILQTESMPHLSWPQAFFHAEPDPHMKAVLSLPSDRLLYGRRNVLLDGSRRLLAEVIEILRPVDTPKAPSGSKGTGAK